jgi:hydroxymethylpyrimidine pyrophosphatase-like HAD family hydrolase
MDSLGPRANVVKADVNFVNIMDTGVNKEAALRWLISYLGVHAASVMAVGDCEADQNMFAVALRFRLRWRMPMNRRG